jgi:hypothetical protein
MLDSTWYIIDGLLFGDFVILENIFKTFMDSDKKRILFCHYFFDLDDCVDEGDYTKSDCIDDEFEHYKSNADSSVDYEKISAEVKDMLYREYCRLFGQCDEFVKKDLHNKFINDDINFLDEGYIYSVKEFIARETLIPHQEQYCFITERKVLENYDNLFFTKANLYSGEDKKYVWYEPKSKEDLLAVLKEAGFSLCCMITEDVDNFNNYLYAFELFEGKDFLLAINDRVGNFKTELLPKIEKFLKKDNIVLSEKEYLESISEN